MFPCPECGEAAFEAGRCGACGFYDARYAGVKIVAGHGVQGPSPRAEPRTAAVSSAPASAEVEAGPSLMGFESTSLAPPVATDEGSAKTAAKGVEAPGFTYDVCPRCRTPRSSGGPALCTKCGYRLKPRLRRGTSDERWSCRDCGTRNEATRPTCLGCGLTRRGEA